MESAYCCVNAVLRDYARLGLLLAHDGRLGGRQIIPSPWVHAATGVPPGSWHHMQLWGMLYKPDVAILPLSANRDPQDIVHMVRLLRTENPNLKTAIPHPPSAPATPGGGDAGGHGERPEGGGLAHGRAQPGAE